MLFLALFVVVGPVSKLSLDVDLTPFLQVLPAGLSLFSPDYNRVPFGCLLLFAVRTGQRVGCGTRESGHGLAVGREAGVRVFTEAASKDHLVNHVGSFRSL